MLGYGRQSHSYLVCTDGEFKYVRSVSRMPLSKRWRVDKLQEVQFTVQDQHLKRGAKAVPFVDHNALKVVEQGYRRAPRRLELRQGDFDPAIEGHGWTEHCPKCARARLYGWKDSVNLQHSEACRTRIDADGPQPSRAKPGWSCQKRGLNVARVQQLPKTSKLTTARRSRRLRRYPHLKICRHLTPHRWCNLLPTTPFRRVASLRQREPESRQGLHLANSSTPTMRRSGTCPTAKTRP